MRSKIIRHLQQLTRHSYVEITTRGNTAIQAALSAIPKTKKVLIPEEGGWLSYKTIPERLGLEITEVKCRDAKINVSDLEKKLKTKKYGAFLFQNPGGYFAEQPLKRIFNLCQEYYCLVILDVSGAIGTNLSNGDYADFLVGSFGEWKLIDAGTGGFISCRGTNLWKKIKKMEVLEDRPELLRIQQKIEELPTRILFLEQKRELLLKELLKMNLEVVHPGDQGFVVVVKYHADAEKETIINYCRENGLELTECPRYIRLNSKAISIELKRSEE